MKNNNKGFSLIELSIVLIIMGLLIAGVTGGASLIKSAQLNAITTEFNNYKTAYNSYYAQFGKVPGASATDAGTIESGAMAALFDEGLIDKEPGDNDDVDSKFGKGAKWFLTNSSATGNINFTEFANFNILYLSGQKDLSVGALTSVEAQSIDSKIDDGKSNSGAVRGVKQDSTSASAASYDTSDNTTRSYSLITKLDF